MRIERLFGAAPTLYKTGNELITSSSSLVIDLNKGKHRPSSLDVCLANSKTLPIWRGLFFGLMRFPSRLALVFLAILRPSVGSDLDPRIKSEGDGGGVLKHFHHTSPIHPALDAGSKHLHIVLRLPRPRHPRRLVKNTKSAQAVEITSAVIPDLVRDPGRTFQEPQRCGSFDNHA